LITGVSPSANQSIDDEPCKAVRKSFENRSNGIGIVLRSWVLLRLMGVFKVRAPVAAAMRGTQIDDSLDYGGLLV
jgi:hypothetical protein